MTDNIDEQMESEEIEEEISTEPPGPAAQCQGIRIWVVLTIIFVVLSALLAWLYSGQIGQARRLRVQAAQASSQCAMLQQSSRRVANDIVELAHQAALEAELQADLGNDKQAEAKIALSRKFLELSAQLSTGAAGSQKRAATDKIKEVEEELHPPAEPSQEEGGAPSAPSDEAAIKPPN